MDVTGVSKTSIRLLPGGFAWTFDGKNTDTGARVCVTIRFDFCWFKRLVMDLWDVLDFRDQETAAARAVLTSRE